jgi:hypothetical protein
VQAVSWIQIDTAAQAIVDYLDAPMDFKFAHLVHPRPVKWSKLVPFVASQLDVELVSYQVWLTKLEEVAQHQTSDETLVKNLPALRLLDFYRSISKSSDFSNREAFALLDMPYDIAVRGSRALQNVAPLDERHVTAWLKYWNNQSVQ